MSDLLDEHVPPMPPLSMAMIEEVGEKALALFQPEALEKPSALDLCQLVERVLPKYGIFVYPASAVELGDRLGATSLDKITEPDGQEVTILLLSELWDQLYESGRQSNRARATVAHELSHAILHVPVLRARSRLSKQQMSLNRVQRKSIQAYEDPEWQAWALAGCLLSPRKMIEKLEGSTLPELADVFGVSEPMMKSHLKRLKLAGKFAEA